MVDVDLQWGIDREAIPSHEQCVQWVAASLVEPRRHEEVEITVRVVDETESQELNRDYRNKDSSTNVLSFEFEQPPGLVDLGEELPYLGDLIVCAVVVAREADEQQKSLESHWAHMIVHGILHLQGYDHMNEEEAEEMEALEIEIMQSLGYGNPYLQNER